MLPALLVMCKLLFALLLCEGFVGKLGFPFLPFVPSLDLLRGLLGDELGYEYQLAYQGVFLLSGALLWLNVRPRAASIVLGLCVLFLMIGSRPMFRNHVFVVGCFFLLAGLSKPGRSPVLLYWQLSLIYLGAFLDKILLEDWATGRYMDNFLANARVNPVYLAAVEVLPRSWVAGTLSWASMVTELAIGLGFLFRQTRAAAVWLAVMFHFSLYVFLGGDTFGHFLEDLLLAFGVVVAWPREPVRVAPRRISRDTARRILEIFDWDRLFVVCSPEGDPRGTEGRVIPLDRVGWGYALRRTAGFYMLLFAAYELVGAWAPGAAAFPATTLCGVGLMAFLAPAWPWIRRGPPREPSPAVG